MRLCRRSTSISTLWRDWRIWETETACLYCCSAPKIVGRAVRVDIMALLIVVMAEEEALRRAGEFDFSLSCCVQMAWSSTFSV